MSFKREFFSRIHKLVFLIDKEADRALREGGSLTFSQFLILRVAEDCGRAPQQLIARILGVTEASVSRQVKRLAREGLLRLHVNPANRRANILAATRAGAAALRRAEAVLEVRFDELERGVSKREKKSLVARVERMVQLLDRDDVLQG